MAVLLVVEVFLVAFSAIFAAGGALLFVFRRRWIFILTLLLSFAGGGTSAYVAFQEHAEAARERAREKLESASDHMGFTSLSKRVLRRYRREARRAARNVLGHFKG